MRSLSILGVLLAFAAGLGCQTPVTPAGQARADEWEDHHWPDEAVASAGAAPNASAGLLPPAGTAGFTGNSPGVVSAVRPPAARTGSHPPDVAPPDRISRDPREARPDDRDPRDRVAPRSVRKATADLRGGYGTYANPPRDAKGKKDLNLLVDQLVDLNVDTYHYLIYHDTTDWDDLKTLLPMLRERGIKCWVSMMPPSGAYPNRGRHCEPFRLNFEKWAEEIAKLSLKHPHLVAWSIDDFTSDLDTFTPTRVARMQRIAHDINPALAFVPTCYYKKVTDDFARDYGPLIDGILFPYRSESHPPYNVKVADHVDDEIRDMKRKLGPSVPIILDVYASRVGNQGVSTPNYTRRVIELGFRFADGVQVFRHPDRDGDKYEVVREEFRKLGKRPREK